MHPPFGIARYNLRSIAPSSVRTSQIYWGALPFIAIQLLVVMVLIAAPGIVLKPTPPTMGSLQNQAPSLKPEEADKANARD